MGHDHPTASKINLFLLEITEIFKMKKHNNRIVIQWFAFHLLNFLNIEICFNC